MKKKRAEGESQENLYIILNKSIMNRCASGDTPKTENPIDSAPPYEIVRIEQGYNIFNQEEMDIINKCAYTKDSFGSSKWFDLIEVAPIGDRDIKAMLGNTKQMAMLYYLKSQAKSSALSAEIERKIPSTDQDTDWEPPKHMSAL